MDEEIDLAATLPEPCLNYKPLPHITPAQRRQDEDDALAQVIYAKNQRYNFSFFFPKHPSKFDVNFGLIFTEQKCIQETSPVTQIFHLFTTCAFVS